MRLPDINTFDLHGCYIAGGAVLSTVTKQPVSDYDLYPKSHKDMVELCCELNDSCGLVSLSDRALTFKSYNDYDKEGKRVLIQVIRGEFPDPDDIFKNFDFTVCMGAFDCDEGTYTFHEDFWSDVASKTIRFNCSTLYPLNSLIRTYKYTKKGYSTSKTEMAKIALTVAKKGMPNSWEELENEIGGTYGRSLKLARDGEEFSFDKAVEVLSEVTDSCFESYTEVQSLGFSTEELKLILSDEVHVVYKLGDCTPMTSGYFKLNVDGTVSTVEVSDKLKDFGVQYEERDLKDIEYIIAFKQLKKVDDKFIGGVYAGHHNGVEYKPFQETRYDNGENLFCYVKEGSVQKGFYKSVVKVPVKDIISVDAYKIKTKSMICSDIKEDK